jgi:hypothetical protein
LGNAPGSPRFLALRLPFAWVNDAR